MILVLAMGITVNAATGGAIANYFDKLLGVEQTMQITEEGKEPITIHMSDLDIGIYDADQNLVTDLNKADADNISFDIESQVYDGDQKLIEDLNQADADDISFDIEKQVCEIDGTVYHVILLLDLDEGTADNITHGQLRLYTPEDYAQAMETLVLPEGIYCPSIQL